MAINFYDFCKLTPIEQKIVSDFSDSYSSSSKKGLGVTLIASHSGLITGNLKVYIPSRMEDGCSTFTERRKPAKILKHHNMDGDPVGVIVGAEYISTIPDYLKNDRNVKIVTDSSFDIKKQLRAMKDLLAEGVFTSPGWEGLGYIKLKAAILKEEVIDEMTSEPPLWDSVSTFFSSPGHVYCSVCFSNLAKDGKCEHELGEMYEDEEEGTNLPCLWIPAVHKNHECSLVNMDADPLTSISFGDKKDRKTYSFTKDCLEQEKATTKTVYEFKDFQMKEEMMADQNDLLLIEEETKMLDLVKRLRPNVSEEDSLVLAKKVLAEKKDNRFHKDQKDAELSDELTIEYILDYWDTKDEPLDAKAIYVELETGLKDANLSEKILSSDAIKKLSKSTFCGPDKTFPVPDKEHVFAGLKVLDGYKGPLDKVEVLAKINKKAKALGYDATEFVTDSLVEDKPEVPVLVTMKDAKDLTNEEAKNLFSSLETELISRNLKLDRECSKCADKEVKVNEITVEKDSLSVELNELETQLKYLRAELRTQNSDYLALSDELFEIQTTLHGVKVEKASILSVISGKDKTIEEATDRLNTLEIDNELTSMVDSVDFLKVVEKLHDGMSRTPVQGVEDPTLQVESKLELNFDGLSAPAKAAINNIKDYLAEGESCNAKKLYDKMVKMKHIDTKIIPFDLFSVEKKSTEE